MRLKFFKYTLLVSSIMASYTSVCQVAFYDAKTLASKLKTKENPVNHESITFLDKDDPQVKKILHDYFYTTDLEQMNRDIRDNKFMTGYIIGTVTSSDNDENNRDGTNNLKSALSVSAIGGLDVTAIADGFAKFIVKRTKEELSIAFFDKFKKTLEKDEFIDLRTLFPSTYHCLTAIGDQVYNYQLYIQTLRECFEKDITTLPSNLPSIISNHKSFFDDDKNKELKAILLSGFYLAGKIQDHAHPGDIIEGYPDSYLNDLDINYKAGVKTIQIISASLRKQDDDKRYWVSYADVKALFNDANQFQLYMALVTQLIKREQIKFRIGNNDIDLYTSINSNAANAFSYKQYLSIFAQKTDALERKLSTLGSQTNDSLLFENYYSFFSSTIDLLKYIEKIESLPGMADLKIKEKTDKYLDAGQSIANIAIDINRKKYAAAIVDVMSMYDLIKGSKVPYTSISTASKVTAKKIKKAAKAYRKDRTPDNMTALKNKVDNVDSNRINVDAESSSRNIFKYGTFIATIAQAKSSDDVSAAIEAAALPSGSARIKRETSFNVALNAYCGLFAGYEKIEKLDADRCIQWNTYGVTAPIGISISRGHSIFFFGTGKDSWKNGKAGWSTSLFLSIIDLGAVTAFRFNNDTSTTAQVPKIQLKDIFSPGLFLSTGIPKCPISVNFGVQMGPNLRSAGVDGNTYANNVYWRYSISFVVDIPVLNLYTRSK